MSHGILHYLWLADLSKSFFQPILSIFTVLNQYFLVNIYLFSIAFLIDFARWKSLGLPHNPHCLYHDSLTLMFDVVVSWKVKSNFSSQFLISRFILDLILHCLWLTSRSVIYRSQNGTFVWSFKLNKKY